MECDYKSIFKSVWIYYEKSKRLLLNPIGISEDSEWGTEAVPPVIELKLPCEKETLVKAIQETFDNCYKLDWRSSPKEGPAQNYVGIKSQRKFVQIFEKNFVLNWTQEKHYELTIWERDAQGHGWYNVKNKINFGDNIDYDYLLNLFQ